MSDGHARIQSSTPGQVAFLVQYHGPDLQQYFIRCTHRWRFMRDGPTRRNGCLKGSQPRLRPPITTKLLPFISRRRLIPSTNYFKVVCFHRSTCFVQEFLCRLFSSIYMFYTRKKGRFNTRTQLF